MRPTFAIVLAAVAFTLAVAGSSSSAPAVAAPPTRLAAALSQTGLQNTVNSILPVLNARLQNLALPDVTLDQSVPVVGHVTISLTNIKVSGLKIPSASVTMQAPAQLNVGVSGVNFGVTLSFHWRRNHWPHISSHGDVDVSPENGAVSLSVAASVDTAHDGLPVLTCPSGSASFSSLHIHFHGGGVSWLYNLLVDLFKNTLRNALEKAVSAEIVRAVNTQLAAETARLHLNGHVGGRSARADLWFGFNSIAVSAAGTAGDKVVTFDNMFAVANDERAGALCELEPIKPLPVAVPSASADRALQFMLADEAVNCVLEVPWANQALNKSLVPAALPPAARPLLNTTTWAPLIPALYAHYPGEAMEIVLQLQSAAAPPMLRTSSANGVVGTASFAIVNYVTSAAAAPVFTHTLGLEVQFGVDVVTSATGNTTLALTGSVSKLALNFSVLETEIGEISVAPLNAIVDTIAPLVRDALNVVLAIGLPLPSSPGLKLLTPSIEYFDGFVAVSSDINFSPALTGTHLDLSA